MSAVSGVNARDGRSEQWSFREDVAVDFTSEDGAVQLSSHWGEITIERPSAPVRKALHRMRLGPIWLDNVMVPDMGEEGEEGEGFRQWVRLYSVLDRLQPFIVRTVALPTGQPVLSVVPLTPLSRFRPIPLPSDVPIRMSTFADMRTDGTEFRLESPLALHRVQLHRPEAVSLIGALSRPVTAAACLRSWPALAPFAADALAYLAAAGFVVPAPDDTARESVPPVFAEEAALAGWSPVDLMFHTRSTMGRHDNPVGATYPLGLSSSPEPVVMPQRAETAIPLHRPRWEDLLASDPPLTVAMEGRRSTRRYGTDPVTAEELGDLLYRTARVRALLTPPGSEDAATRLGSPDLRLSDRPYPGAGACYELELYITVGRCADIPPGIYHYDPVGHRLEPVSADQKLAGTLLGSAGQVAMLHEPPPVLIIMTARFRRVSWKYESLAYALVLEDVGALYQSLYLVCTAMRLAPCALGLVHTAAAAAALGTDWLLEPSVGQFIVGRAPDALPTKAWHEQPVNDPGWFDQARAHLASLELGVEEGVRCGKS